MSEKIPAFLQHLAENPKLEDNLEDKGEDEWLKAFQTFSPGASREELREGMARLLEGMKEEVTSAPDSGELTDSTLDAVAGGTSQTDMMKMQQMMQKWTMATQLQSNTLKTIGEAMKNTVKNLR